MAGIELWRNGRNSVSPNSLFRTWGDLSRNFDNFFSDFDQSLGNSSNDKFAAPAMDVEENAKSYLLSFDMPGFKPNDINVDLHGRTLTVTGKRSRTTTDNRLHSSEKFYGEFRRTLLLPENVKGDQVEANYEHGVLSLTVPKAQAAQSRKIEIGTKPKIDHKVEQQDKADFEPTH